MVIRPRYYAIIIALVLIAISGCGTLGGIFGKKRPAEKPAEELLTKGLEYMDRGLYDEATKAFQELADKYPYHKAAIEAELRLADSLFLSREYQEAKEAYANFERLHPRDPNVPYVIYKMGLCHFNQIKGLDRDLENAKEARSIFERLIRQYPKSRYARMAKENLNACYKVLANHEIYVGKFYFRNGKYEAAIARFKTAVEEYPDVGQYNEALDFIARAKEAIEGTGGGNVPWWNLPKKLLY